ncbi:transmembrane protein 176B-like [Varanus komodoensis]|uniref:transmembrane protein 176B-like n=1 Tax=Varanus komodoensis TaxID=61221 RepID=UPI001CF79394|nr:transmembrane protein 176B-like [Varanus komodoensis]
MPGGVQILLGVVCISLGVVVDYERAFYAYFWAGAPYWMGSLFILSGVFTVVGNRRGGCWIPVATILNLASVIAASVALTYGIARIPNLQPFYDYKVEMCRRRVDPLRTTSSPGSSDYDWEDEQCKELLWHLLAVAFSVRVLLLIFSCIALGVALCCFAYGIRVMCLKARGGAYTKLQDQEVPLPYEDPGRPEALP